MDVLNKDKEISQLKKRIDELEETICFERYVRTKQMWDNEKQRNERKALFENVIAAFSLRPKCNIVDDTTVIHYNDKTYEIAISDLPASHTIFVLLRIGSELDWLKMIKEGDNNG